MKKKRKISFPMLGSKWESNCAPNQTNLKSRIPKNFEILKFQFSISRFCDTDDTHTLIRYDCSAPFTTPQYFQIDSHLLSGTCPSNKCAIRREVGSLWLTEMEWTTWSPPPTAITTSQRSAPTVQYYLTTQVSVQLWQCTDIIKSYA